jgi:hypothetical protein
MEDEEEDNYYDHLPDDCPFDEEFRPIFPKELLDECGIPGIA